MNVHEDIGALAEPFVLGELPEERDAEVAAHAEACPECLAFLQEVEARLRAPDPFWRSPGARRAAKALVFSALVAGLVVLGGVFQSGGASAPAVEAAEEAVYALSRSPAKAFGSGAGGSQAELLKAVEQGAEAGGREGGRMLRARGGSGGAPQAPAIPFQDDRKIVRHAQLQIEVDAFEEAHDLAVGIAASEGGFLAGVETQRLPNGKASGTLTVRIPSERFDAVLPRFRELGAVRHQSVQTQDVTKAYVDLKARLGSKQALVERLKKVLADAQGTVKELLEVELEMSRAVEAIEAVQGQIRYYDNVVGLSTVVLQVTEKDIARPFEYVETLRADLALNVRDAEAAYLRVQAVVAEAGGQVLEARLTREGEGPARGTLRAHVDAEKLPAVREALRTLGGVVRDTVDRQRVAQGGAAAGAPAPLKRERAVLTVALAAEAAPVSRWSRLEIEADDVASGYQEARKAMEEAGARLTGGSLEAGAERSAASLTAELDAERLPALLARLGSLGKTKSSGTRHALPGAAAASVGERAQVELALATPDRLLSEEHGLARTLRETFAGSVAGLLWSVERLVVGLSLAGPWAMLALAGCLLWRRLRRRKEAPARAAA